MASPSTWCSTATGATGTPVPDEAAGAELPRGPAASLAGRGAQRRRASSCATSGGSPEGRRGRTGPSTPWWAARRGRCSCAVTRRPAWPTPTAPSRSTCCEALAGTAVPAPVVIAADLGGARLDRPAVVLERAEGRAHRAVLRSRDPLGLGADAQRAPGRRACRRARPRPCRSPSTSSAAVLGRVPSDPAGGEIRRWEAEIDRVRLEPQPELAYVATWLWEHRPPPPPRPALVHGDMRPANVLVEALAAWCSCSTGSSPTSATRPRTSAGTPRRSTGRALHRRELGRAGLPGPVPRRRGLGPDVVEPERLHFWQVLALFKLGAIALAACAASSTGRPIGPPGPADRRCCAPSSRHHPRRRRTAREADAAETLAGIAAILRTTVAPAVGDAHARRQLHQIMTVLGQLQVDDPAANCRRRRAAAPAAGAMR